MNNLQAFVDTAALVNFSFLLGQACGAEKGDFLPREETQDG
jgi:hypothetical protein